MSHPISSTILALPSADLRALTESDFTLYETTVNGTLELQELEENGKLEEFAWRFLSTPVSLAKSVYVGKLSQALVDALRDWMSGVDASTLDAERGERLAYWLENDFEKRFFTTGFDFGGGYAGSSYELSEGDSSFSSRTGSSSGSASAFVKSDHPLGRWRWVNKISLKGQGAYSSYSFRSDESPPETEREPGLNYTASGYTELRQGENASLSLAGLYQGVAGPLPDALSSKREVSAAGDFGLKLNGRVVSGNALVVYDQFRYAPPAVADQVTRSSDTVYSDAETSYQSGKFGVVGSFHYTLEDSVTSYEELHEESGRLSAVAKMEPTENLGLQAGFGGQRDVTDSSLTGLSTEEAEMQASTKLTWKVSPKFKTTTSFQGARIYSQGSLDGWYWSVPKAEQSVRYVPGQVNFGVTVGVSGYDRALVYAEDGGLRDQSELKTSVSADVEYAPRDWIMATGKGKWSVADQEGFVAVDERFYSFTGSAGMRVSSSSARRAAWLSLNGEYYAKSSQAEGASYQEDSAIVSLNLSVR